MAQRPTGQLEAEQAQLEARALGAVAAGLARLAQWRSLQASAQRYNIRLRDLLPPALLAANEQADKDFAAFARAVASLQAGRAYLQRLQIADGPIKWGVRRDGSTLGQWQPVAVAVVRYASQAAIAVGAWHLFDLWGASNKIEQEGKRLRAENSNTCQQTAAALTASGHAAEGAALATECARADAAAEQPDPSLWDQFTQGFKQLAVGAGSGAILLAVAFFLFSRTRAQRSRRR